MISQVRINKDRLRRRLEAMAEVGRTAEGGVTRLALSDEDRAGRLLLIKWFEEQGCHIHVDPLGNIFATLTGDDPDLPPVLTGSHNDTQPNGGRFDGTLGILAGLEVITTLREHGIRLPRDLIVVDWTNEEGSRFSPGCTGSGVWAGKLDQDAMRNLRDQGGTSLIDELDRIGFRGELDFPRRTFHAAFELHIEQGPVLDREGIAVGIPAGIVGSRWYRVTVLGEANHAGTTPMSNRNDALYTFSQMCQQIREIGASFATVVATVGHVSVRPNSLNVIPGQVDFTIDIRGWEVENTNKVCRKVEFALTSIAEQNGCNVQFDRFWQEERTIFSPELQKIIAESCQDLGLSYKEMYSGANHDMIYMHHIAPGAMIFVPSIDGKSHSVLENTWYDDCAAGTDVLLHSILKVSK